MRPGGDDAALGAAGEVAKDHLFQLVQAAGYALWRGIRWWPMCVLFLEQEEDAALLNMETALPLLVG